MHGGVYVFAGGKAVRVDGSPDHVLGIASAGGTLYVNGGSTILAWSGWDGRRFAHSRVVVTGPHGFTGFNGIIAAPGGRRLYAGISLGGGTRNDSAHGTTPLANSVVSIDVATGAITTVATGYRQPWQFAFLPGHAAPLVSDLGQENLGAHRPPDFIIEARAGTDAGFPACPQHPTACVAAAPPFATFPAHASPMGLGVLGQRLYVALYAGTGAGPDVVSLPLTGGARPRPLLVGFRAPVVALGVHAGRVYAEIDRHGVRRLTRGGVRVSVDAVHGCTLAPMPRHALRDPEPLAVLFHEKDRSTASGLRFGTVEVLLADDAPIPRGYLPKIGAEAVARELGVPLLVDPQA